jgi:putative membrane protein
MLNGLMNFGLYFGVGIGLVALYLAVYTFATAHNEIALIRQNVLAAGLALGASLIGFALPLSSAIVYSRNIVDCIIWGLVALVVQIVVYYLVRIILPDLSRRIAGGEISAALFLGCASLAAGVINAASMSY